MVSEVTSIPDLECSENEEIRPMIAIADVHIDEEAIDVCHTACLQTYPILLSINLNHQGKFPHSELSVLYKIFF